MNEPYRLRYANQVVGMVLLLLLFFVIVVGIVLTRASGYFATPNLVELQLPQSEIGSLHKGTEIIQLGKRIGQVSDLEYVGESDLVNVTLAVDPQHQGVINADSEVTVERKFGLGAPVLRISRKQKKEKAAEPVDASTAADAPKFKGQVDRVEQMAQDVDQVRAAVERIQAKLNPTLNKIGIASDRVTESLNSTVDPAMVATEQAMNSVGKTSEEVRPKTIDTLDQIKITTIRLENTVDQLAEKVQSLIENDIKKTIGSVRDSATAAEDAAKSVRQTSEQLNETRQQTSEEISETLSTLRETAKLVQTLTNETREIVHIVRREANDLPGTTERINDTVHETQELVGEIRSHWLLRRYHDASPSSEQVSPSSVHSGGAW